MADGFDDDGTKSHTSNLAFLGSFSITNPKMFFLIMLCIAKDLTFEIVEVRVGEKSALSSDLLQSPEEKHSSFHICLLTVLISISVQHSNVFLTLSLCISRSVGL